MKRPTGIGTSAEFELVVDCCHCAFSRESAARFMPPAERIDWPRFIALARRHRVEALVHRGLREAELPAPPEVLRELGADARRTVSNNLKAIVECGRIQARFAAGGLSILFLKGVTLGALAYPQPLLKMSWDIDLLVRREELPAAAELMTSLGYRRLVPSSGTLEDWHKHRKESVWLNEESGQVVDLHTRLSDNPGLLAGVGIDSPTQQVEVGAEIALPTLKLEELFAYLCVHGASSAWFRLKWITDLSALIARSTADEVGALYLRSQDLGAGRSAAQALLLAERVYGVQLPVSLQQRLRASRVSRVLERVALSQLAGSSASREPTERPLGTLPLHLSQLLLLPGTSFKVRESVRQLRDLYGNISR